MARASRNWTLQFAIFEAAYPGKDPLTLTLYGFLERVNIAPYAHAILHGRYTFEMQADMKADEIIEELEIKRLYPACFPESLADE